MPPLARCRWRQSSLAITGKQLLPLCLIAVLLCDICQAVKKKAGDKNSEPPPCTIFPMAAGEGCLKSLKRFYGPQSPEACAALCAKDMPDTASSGFCFDYQEGSGGCGCSQDHPEEGKPEEGWDRYMYLCTGLGGPPPLAPLPPRRPAVIGQLSFTSKDTASSLSLASSAVVQQRLKTLTYLLTICSNGHSVSAEELKQRWFSGYSEFNMEDYIDACSYGKAVWPEKDNYVIEITVPCSSNGPSFSFDRCGDSELYGWAAFARGKAEKMGIRVNEYQQQILVLPEGNACRWTGIAMQSCWKQGNCISWLNYDAGRLPLDSVAHEVWGHNWGLLHSQGYGYEYGDTSCIMGAHPGLRCFSAPQTWALGWSKWIADLSEGDLPVGTASSPQWTFYDIPALVTSDTNFLRLNKDLTGLDYNLFISYRSPVSYDKQLADKDRNVVFVHRYDAGLAKDMDVELPELLVRIHVDQHWPETPGSNGASKVVLRVMSRNDGSAKVGLCVVNDGTECGGLGYYVAREQLEVPGFCHIDGVCGAGETFKTCPIDCQCGDGFCHDDENVDNCPQDCASDHTSWESECGDGVCHEQDEDCFTCPQDCAMDLVDKHDMDTWVCCGGAANGRGCSMDMCWSIRPDGRPFRCIGDGVLDKDLS